MNNLGLVIAFLTLTSCAFAEVLSVQPLSISLTSQVSGTLPVTNGGTGTTSSTGSGSVVKSNSPTLTGTPALATPTASGTISSTATETFRSIGAATFASWYQANNTTRNGFIQHDSINISIDNEQIGSIILYTSGTDRARIDSAGRLIVGYTGDQGGGEMVQVAGTVKATGLTILTTLCSSTAPTVSGFGTSAAVVSHNGTCAFTVDVGTGGLASTGTVNLPAANVGWVCNAQDVTTPAMYITSQTGGTTTTATFTNYSRTTGLATAWTASDVLRVSCMGY